jgi:hypothetical protein
MGWRRRLRGFRQNSLAAEGAVVFAKACELGLEVLGLSRARLGPLR